MKLTNMKSYKRMELKFWIEYHAFCSLLKTVRWLVVSYINVRWYFYFKKNSYKFIPPYANVLVASEDSFSSFMLLMVCPFKSAISYKLIYTYHLLLFVRLFETLIVLKQWANLIFLIKEDLHLELTVLL